MLNEDAKWIYESMSAKGYDLQSEEHFEELLKNNEDAKWIYDESSKIGLDLGDYTHFEDLIGKVEGATKEADIIEDDESLTNSKKRDGYQTMIDSHTSFAEKHIKEQEEKKAQQAKVQDNYMTAGLSEQDKTDRAEYEKLMSDKVMNQISETFGIEQPKVNQYGMPVVESAKEEADLTTISRPRTVGIGEEVIPFKSSEQKVDEKIAAMPSYITRGEDDTHKINANAFERALNTKEGKELYKQIFDNEAFLFKHSNEGMALLEQYINGEISEEDFERIFREKVGPTIDDEFLGEITSEGGIMRDYFVIAREKLGKDTSKKEANAVDYAIQEYELEKEKEFNNKVREAYKEKYGVYPEDDKSVRYNAANDGLLLRWRRLEDIKSNIREQEQTGYRTSEITGETKEYRKDLPQILQISGAKEFNEDAKEIIDAVENKGFGDFFKAFGRTASDMDTWDLGISALLRNGALLEVVEKADRKEKLTREEQLLMDAALNYMAVSAFYSSSIGRGYKAGTTSAASIQFMIQFALSAGALSAMEASLAGSAKAAGTKLINALAKHGMQKMANVAASEATKAIGKASVGMLSSLIGAGALTAVWDIPSIASGSIERQIGDITPVYNKEGNAFVYGGREHKQSPKEATWNAFADKYVERLSEMVLAKTFAPIEAYASGTRMFKNLAKNDIIGAIIDIRNTPFIKDLREKAMFGGLFEEMMEEELGGLLRMATMSDVNTFKEAGLDMDGQIDIFLGLAPTSLLFSAGGTASHYGKLAVRSKKLRDSLVTDAERKLFDNLMSESRSGKFGELAHDFIRNVILADRTKDGRKITNEDKRDALITVLTKYQDVLSEELQKQTKAVKKEENDTAIDNAVHNMRYKETDDIFFVKDENGKKYVIVDGNAGFNQIQGGLVVDSSRSDSHVSVREVLGNGLLGKVEKVRTASLTDNVHPMSTKTYTEWNQAKHQAEVDEKEIFEYNGIVFDTATSKRLGTKEEYEKKKKEDEAVKNEGKPTINTEPRKMKNEKFQLVVDGKKQSVTFYNAGLVQNEDGSINKEDSDLFIIEANGEKVNRRNQDEYIDALSEHLKSEHAKAIEEYNQKQNAENNVEPVAPVTALTDEDRAAAAAEQERMAKEAEKQTILASAQQKKAKKYTPEETVVVLMEQGNDVATRLVGSRIDKLHAQIDEINADETKDELEKWEDSKELSDQLTAYEQAITKWLGQETLDAINAARVQALQNTPPVQGEAPAVPAEQAPVVEPAQDETPADSPTGPDTTPLPLPVATVDEEGTEGEGEGDGETPAPDMLGEEGGVEGNEEGEEPAPAADKPTANLDEVTVWVAKNYDYIVTDKEGNTIFSSKPTRKKVTDAFEELHQVEGKVDGKRGTYNGEDCIIVRDNPAKGYVNIVTPHGIERVGREEVMIDGKPLKGKASVVEWRENNEKKYDSFESIMNFPVFDIIGEMNITFLDFLNTQQDSPYVAFYEMLRKHYREKYDDDVAQQYLDASVARLIENLKEVARLWNIVRTKRLISSGQMPTTLERKKMDSQSKRMKEAVAAVHNAVGLDNSIDFSGLAELSEKAAKKAEKKGEGEGYFAETDEEKAESYVDGLVSNILWVGFESENKHEHEDAVEGIVEALNKESKKASKLRELVVNILNDRLEEAKRLNRLNDIQSIERVIDRLSTLKKMKPILTEAGLIEEKGKKTPTKPAPKKDTSKLVEQLSLEENSLRDMEEEYKTTTDAEEKSELEGYIAQAKEKIAKLKAEIDGAEFMVGDVSESSASQEAKELALAAEMQSLTDNEEIEVINVTAEQAEEARRTGKGEMQVSNETQRIFVSNAERAVESIKQEKATPQQWKAMIEKQGGLKAGEDKWLGLSEWLDNQDKKTLTKQDILDFIAENQIQIEELGYTEDGFFGTPELEALDEEYKKELSTLLDAGVTVETAPYEAFDKMVEKYGRDFKEGFYGTSFGLGVNNTYYIGKLLNKPQINPTRKRYTTNGLTNKQEIAITVPSVRPYNEGDHIHFGDAGNGRAVAWVRFGETEDADGNRVLVIDEIQSKRHQDGREKGYSNTELHKKIEEAEQKLADIYAKSSNNVQRINELISEIKGLRKDNEEKEDAERYELARLREEQNNVRNNRDYDRLQAEIDEISEIQLKRLTHISKLNTELRLLQERELDNDEVFDLKMEIRNYELELLDKVPDAPFEKNWHELAFKRMLRYAAENGYDYVAWTTGAQQAERYDIGEVINKIITTSYTLRGNPRKSVRILMTNGNRVSMSIDNTGIVTRSDGGIYNGKNLSEIVGKELADRIINNEGKDATLYSDFTKEEIPAKELSGDNLRIGGEGMKGFYDKMLPSFVSKYTKKWGAKVQDINLPELEEVAQTMHAVNVTPEMKESVMEGQPMFSIESTPLTTSKGVIYGYALGNKIYLTPDGMNTNTPVHEYTHLWAKAMQKHNPKAWKSIVEQLKKAEALWNEVVNDPNYENIKNDEDAIASEVLSRYSGKNGAAKLEAEAEQVVTELNGVEKGLKVKALINRVKKALNQFWSWVGKDLFKIESFESVESIADRVLYDMLNNTKLNLDNSKKSSTFAENNENYERTDEFRELQERSLGLSQSDIARYQSEQIVLSDEDKRGIGGVFQRLMESKRNGGRNGQWINLTGKGNQFKIAQVNPAIFHDIFQICRNYLPNGELVDLHDNYADCKCFLSEDGLCGFAIEPDGNLISVFSLNPRDKKGFLYAIKDLIRQEGATHLDCFVSNKQPLSEIYQKVLGFHVASEMDYNMEYDHDNIAENHGMPKVAFMVDKPTEEREFDGESYDAAYDYQQSQTSTAEREQIIADAKANGTFMMHNGQPTNLTEDQWVTVRTQAFKDYFGDWINDKDNASVVLDENGEPLVVYHGSRMAGFDKFGRGEARDSQGIYTTPNRRAAESYATSAEEWRSGQTMPEAELGVPDHHGVYSLFVNMRNPKVIDFGGKEFDRFGTPKYEVATNEALNYGERGILFDTLEETEAYIAEHPEEDLDYVEKYTTSDDMLLQAKEEGYDGVIFTNIIDSRYPDPINNYVPFESNQVKSATQNVGTFNPEDDRIEFMIGPAAPTGAPVTDPTLMLDEEALKALEVKSKKYAAKLANPKVQLPEEIDGMFVAKNFDRTEGIRRIMNSIAEYRKAHGMPKMGEGFDVRTMIETKDSKINNKIASFDNNQVKRLEKIVRKWTKVIEKSAMYEKYKNEQMRNQDGEVTTLTPIEFLERYLIACDSIEREALTKNPRGIGGFLNRMGINVIQFHNEFVSEFASDTNGKKMREELWEAVRGVTRVTLEVGKESGLISQEEYDKDIKRQFYVPERDFAEVEANKQLWIEGAAWRKSKRGARLRAMQKSKEQGGLSLAANILSNMLDLTYDAIAKAEENKVKVAMFDLLSANEAWCNENRVPVPVRVWYEKDADGKPVRRTTEPSRSEREEMKKYKSEVRKLENLILNETDKKLIYESKIDELKEELKKSHTPEERLEIETDIRELETLILQINDNIDEWHEDIEVYKSMYPYMDTIDVRNILFETKEQQKAETVIAYVDGVPCEMHFPNMQIVADALNNVSYNDWYFDDVKKVTSYASAIFTVYNPTFFTVNLVRDIPWILKKGYSEYGWQFPVRFAAKLIAETFSSTLWKAVAGKDYSDSIYAEYMKEFYEGGGNTGYTQLPEMQRIKKHVAKWGEKKLVTWGDVGKVMSFMNEWSEVLTRSAAYSVVRDMGYNQEEGIRAAKNLSVNFNRKGLGSKFMNLFSSFSMFANAVVQGACGFYRTFKPNEDTQLQRAMHVTRAVMSIGFAPAFAGFISTLLQPDDEDDFLVSDWERDNYFILGDVRIPLSEQLKPFWCIGVNIALGMHGKRNGKDIARSLINSFFVNLVPAPNSFNSTLQMLTDAIFGYKDFSGAALVDNLLTPQVLKNTNSIANNSNFMGGKFRYDYGDVPEFVMGENDPYIYRCIAKLAYNMAGGDEYVKSTSVKEVNEYGEVEYVPMSKAMNINPKQIEAWASVFVPSGFRDIANAVAVTIGKIAGDEDAKFEAKEFNSVTRFYKQQDKDMNQYFLLKDIKKEIEYYNHVKSTAKKNIVGGGITGNEELAKSAEAKFENLSNNTLKLIEASLIEQYDKLHMDKIAKKYALTGDELKEHLSDKEIIKIDKERDNILRKILILDMERKGDELFTYDDFEKEQKYPEEEKRNILGSQIYNEVRAKRPK